MSACVCGHELGSDSCCNFDDDQGALDTPAGVIEQMAREAAEANAPEPRQLGVKHRKLARFDLIPKDVLWEVAEVLGWGASNRGDSERNWEKGLRASDLVSGIYRHVSQWESGELADEDTGRSHLAHAICLLMFLRGLEMRDLLVDDRGERFGPLRSELVS